MKAIHAGDGFERLCGGGQPLAGFNGAEQPSAADVRLSVCVAVQGARLSADLGRSGNRPRSLADHAGQPRGRDCLRRGRNIPSHPIADLARITALDLSHAHIALNKLNLHAARHLPSAGAFYRFFGERRRSGQRGGLLALLSRRSSTPSRAPIGSAGALAGAAAAFRCSRSKVYRHGLLGRCIGFAHMLARLFGIDPRDVLRARSLAEQRSYFDNVLAPLFDKRLVRWLARGRFRSTGSAFRLAQYHARVRRR